MDIVLKEDLNPRRHLTAGAKLDWDRPVITAITKQLGRSDWYEPLESFEAKARRKGKVR
jgi:hypothetical protein